eukprot:CAMPEP_0183296808 /NCGR_PEP_ID=MMETSP0160_2-20130417/4246_1 /TAXON_ID=2839 ORGANISM="Odontella Sinensis, Strain Grunow 1884" /NCGR_SAMPLE_ID=MMETSP0160_2 /ASSEMBLY_ACC=CAM_ASM_000250 /LENGTH=132 /DNA_ID=CAMNT_0025458485 /DNA_START=140 /DNA_END=534 /DNA_ORIENTATION=+
MERTKLSQVAGKGGPSQGGGDSSEAMINEIMVRLPAAVIKDIFDFVISEAVAVAAGNNHCLALKQDGSVIGWGRNDHGQTTIPGGLSQVRAVAAGRNFSLALRKDGTVAAWGNNDYGQTKVPDGLAGVKAIS